MHFTMLSQNIDDLPTERFNKSPIHLRLNSFLSELMKTNYDIVCIQEITLTTLQKLKNKISQEYNVFVGNSVINEYGTKIFSPIFFLKKYSFVKMKSFFIKKYVINFLEIKYDNKTIGIINLHLSSNNEKDRLDVINEICNNFNETYEDEVIIFLVGDFNSRPIFPSNEKDYLYDSLIQKRYLPIDNIYTKLQKNDWKDTYLSSVKDINTYHDYIGKNFPEVYLRIDWILVNTKMYLANMHQNIIKNDIISDHYPVTLSIDFNFDFGLLKGPNKSLNNIYASNNITFQINSFIYNYCLKYLKKGIDIKNIIKGLILKYDFREIIKIIDSDKNFTFFINKIYNIDRFNSITKDKLNYKYNSSEIKIAKSLEEFFKEQRNTIVFFFEEQNKYLQKKMHNIFKNTFQFFYQLHDLYTFSTANQDNNIKYFYFAGKKYILKKSNDKKEDALHNEILSYNFLAKNLSKIHKSTSDFFKNQFKLKIKLPLALIYDSINACYFSLMEVIEGVTLEEIIVKKAASEKYLLTIYRDILLSLIDVGFLWYDMAPRNIIVNKASLEIFILDFEKSSFLENVTPKQRENFFRSQIISEELCAFFNMKDILAYLGDLYNPYLWKDSTGAVEFRPEILDIARVHKKETNKFYCNMIDFLSVTKLNPVFVFEKKCIMYPINMKSKIEHYLSSFKVINSKDYERKILEILLNVTNTYIYSTVLNYLFDVITNIEKSIYYSLIDKNYQFTGLIETIKKNIDELYIRNNNIHSIGNYLKLI